MKTRNFNRIVDKQGRITMKVMTIESAKMELINVIIDAEVDYRRSHKDMLREDILANWTLDRLLSEYLDVTGDEKPHALDSPTCRACTMNTSGRGVSDACAYHRLEYLKITGEFNGIFVHTISQLLTITQRKDNSK